MKNMDRHHVIIIGGGFGGLFAAQHLRHKKIDITLIDKRNYHLFQPLLYQVATGGLSPGDIASPLRAVLKRFPHIKVLKGEVTDIQPRENTVMVGEQTLAYDTLIVATGVRHHYFGNGHWAKIAPGLKTVEDALEMRRRILDAFEEAENEPDPERRAALMRFVIVGAGPTGVELAGALGELAHATMKRNFRNIDPSDAEIILLEGAPQVLPPFPEQLGGKARKALERLGVTVKTNTLVTNLEGDRVTWRQNDQEHSLNAATVLWAAGVKVNAFGQTLAERAGVECDRVGRIVVNPDLSVPGFENLLVIGDLAHTRDNDGKPLPGVAPVAMQQGRYVARLIQRRLDGRPTTPFRYLNKGNLAVIGRNAAVADLNIVKLSGLPAWLIWAFVHIHYLIEFGNKFVVSFQWAWNYLTRKRGARLITGKSRSE